MKAGKLTLFASGLAMFAASCSSDDSGSSSVDKYATDKKNVMETYANIVYASYEDSYNTAKDLQTAINAFVDNPDATTHKAAKDAWLAAREPYGQTEAYRFANGPIDDEDGPEGSLNAWPLDEAHIDYVQAGTGDDEGNTINLINNTTDFPSITEQILLDQNENPGEKNIAIGYHAIEFLLWGQDLNAGGDFSNAGARSHTDFVTDGSGTNDNQQRRGEYLKLASSILIGHLEEMVNEWAPNADNYRSEFLAQSPNTALKDVLSGIGILSKSELATERIFVALDNSSASVSGQEDEHSCFSDNTHRDIITNAMGIQNVYLGEYTRVDGSKVEGFSFEDLMEKINASLNTEMKAALAESMTGVNAIPTPFDEYLTKENVGGTGPIMTSVTKLQAQGDKIAEVAKAIGFTISTDLPE